LLGGTDGAVSELEVCCTAGDAAGKATQPVSSRCITAHCQQPEATEARSVGKSRGGRLSAQVCCTAGECNRSAKAHSPLGKQPANDVWIGSRGGGVLSEVTVGCTAGAAQLVRSDQPPSSTAHWASSLTLPSCDSTAATTSKGGGRVRDVQVVQLMSC
jgi:hypothetical protein